MRRVQASDFRCLNTPDNQRRGIRRTPLLFHERGQALPRTGRGLAAIDTLLDDDVDKHALAGFARPIGMFYGDVLTHTIPGAHWEVIEEAYPRVCITRTAAVDVIGVAMRRLEVADPTLEQNYAHVLERLGLET
ncbi:DUF6278 family protein [Arthrobacter sp. ISL-65]|uniref:DUF6278 family protein n=1 Tax=Arthrobacter sp. ISL-65 TaxID=2819112 RepID=UPI0035A936C4